MEAPPSEFEKKKSKWAEMLDRPVQKKRRRPEIEKVYESEACDNYSYLLKQ